jgi:Na+/melibiose symporter-like transporter
MQTSKVMTVWQLAAFGVLTTPLAMVGFALVIYIPTYYATTVGLGLSAVGAVFLAGRVFDVFTDPLVGHLSDQTRHRLGPRLPWMLIGVPGLALSAWLLLAPPQDAGLLYLIGVSAAFFIFYTVLDVPYSSIGLEISPNTHERSYIASSKAIFQVVGAILASLIPVVLASQMGISLSMIASVAIGLLALGLVAFLMFVPRPKQAVAPTRMGLRDSWQDIKGNAALRYLVIAFFIVQGANALTAGLTVLYISNVIAAPSLVGQFFLIVFVSTAVFLPLWVWISKKSSKQTAWICSILLCCCALFGAFWLGQGDVALLLGFGVVLGAAFGCDAVMPTSMLADLVTSRDKAQETRRGATYLAIKNAVSKLTFVLPMGLAFPVLDLAGFQDGGSNGEAQITTFLIFFAGLPIALRLCAVFLLSMKPISAE